MPPHTVNNENNERAANTMSSHQQQGTMRNGAAQISQILASAQLSDCGVTGFRVINDVVYYRVMCIVKSRSVKWTMLVRFQELHELHSAMKDVTKDSDLALPPFPERHAKIITDHLNVSFIRQRRVLLDSFLHRLAQVRAWRTTPQFLEFCVPGKHVLDENAVVEQFNASDSDPFAQCAEEDKRIIETLNTIEEQASMEPYEVTAISIPSAQILRQNHVMYQIDVSNDQMSGNFSSWVVLKRYDEFAKLDAGLREHLKKEHPLVHENLPSLPPKCSKLLVDHFNIPFIEMRRILLESYLRVLIAIPIARTNPLLLQFLGI